MILCFTLTGYLIATFNMHFLFLSIGISVPFSKIITFLPIIGLLSSLPISFLGFGTREDGILYFFSKYASKEKLLSIGILFSFVVLILPTLISLIFMRHFLNELLKK
jgi:hypothetical protein